MMNNDDGFKLSIEEIIHKINKQVDVNNSKEDVNNM